MTKITSSVQDQFLGINLEFVSQFPLFFHVYYYKPPTYACYNNFTQFYEWQIIIKSILIHPSLFIQLQDRVSPPDQPQTSESKILQKHGAAFPKPSQRSRAIFIGRSRILDIAVIQWIMSCHKSLMATHVITIWGLSAMSVSTLRFLFEIMFILKTIKSNFKGS